MDAPQGRKLLAAVWRPAGSGPFPVVVLLHASSGFSPGFVLWGRDFANAGFLAVAASWFAGQSPQWPAPLIDNPEGPPFAGATFESIKYARAVVKAARTLPGANGSTVGLIGQSRGATASVILASTGAAVQGVVSDSGNYTHRGPIDSPPISVVQDLAAPLLMLHGTADQTVKVQEARDYEQALRRLNRPYEVKYYEGAAHVVTAAGSPNRADAMGLAISFFKKHLQPPATPVPSPSARSNP